jgi:hypothetical protein
MFVPALKMPVAKARSFFGNHSVTALMPPGKPPPSPTPSRIRTRMKCVIERAAAWAMCASVQSVNATARPSFAPMRSTKRPKNRYDSAYAAWNQVTMLA